MTSSKFFKTTMWTRSTGSCNFVVFEKFTLTCLHQIALEVILLPIRIYIYIYHSAIVSCFGFIWITLKYHFCTPLLA